MAVFGTLVDRTLGTRAGDSCTGVYTTTLAHSLPATSAETIFSTMRSIQAVGVAPNIQMLAQRGNASLNTIGFVLPSAASTPTVEFEVTSVVWHSIVR